MSERLFSEEVPGLSNASGESPVEVPLESVEDMADPVDFTVGVHDRVIMDQSYGLLRAQVEDVLTTLTRRQKTVLRMRFGLDDGESKTLRQVGVTIGRSKSTAWREEKEALRKLRNPSRAQRLRSYLE